MFPDSVSKAEMAFAANTMSFKLEYEANCPIVRSAPAADEV